MKRLFTVLLAVFCLLSMAIPAAAQSQASQISAQSAVSNDGSCRVTVTATVVYEEAVASPVFPIPSGADNVVLNGSPATVYPAASSRMVSLKDVTRGNAGTFTFSLSYSLSAVVTSTQDGSLMLSIQLLSGFPYPVADWESEITLPGAVPERPTFLSGYYQEAIGDRLSVKVEGSRVHIRSAEPLKDHETLTMTLPVSAKMFPHTARKARVLSLMDLAIVVAILLAVGYFFLTMRPRIPHRPSRPTAPDGITAGDIPLWLTGGCMDFSMLVITWAQLGYLRIQVEDSGRVLLHKRMDMGNERSAFENRCYNNLFGRRRMVDGTGFHYAQLCRSVMKKSPRAKEVYRKESGNPWIYRGLCALSAALCGVAMAGAIAAHATWLMILFAVLTGLFGLAMQAAGRCLPLRSKMPAVLGAGCGVLWMILGIWSGHWMMALLVMGFQFLAGIGLCYGGRRTELGQQALKEIMGLRRFMVKVSKRELQQLLKANPSYFHELAPYALALSRDRAFARRFGRLRLPECTYLICGNQRQMTAAEWASLLRTTADTLDARARKLPLEKLLGR